jgi:DNA-binding MarR family transcriptional regulator
MSNAYSPHDVNVIGAFALATADRLTDTATQISGADGAASAALASLAHYEQGQTINGLAVALRVSHSRAVRIGDALERDGLARRSSAPDDRRAVRLRLTGKGKRVAARVKAARAAVLGDTLAALGPDEVSEFARLASKVLESVTTGRAHAHTICRLCDAIACGHFEGHCPVTNGASAREPQPA